MTAYDGYPLIPCDHCGSSDQVRVLSPVHFDRDFGPGEWAVYTCDYCVETWTAIVPEPPDRYEGDGVFAANH